MAYLLDAFLVGWDRGSVQRDNCGWCTLREARPEGQRITTPPGRPSRGILIAPLPLGVQGRIRPLRPRQAAAELVHPGRLGGSAQGARRRDREVTAYTNRTRLAACALPRGRTIGVRFCSARHQTALYLGATPTAAALAIQSAAREYPVPSGAVPTVVGWAGQTSPARSWSSSSAFPMRPPVSYLAVRAGRRAFAAPAAAGQGLGTATAGTCGSAPAAASRSR